MVATQREDAGLGPFRYNTTDVPQGYVCTACGVTGCKLWRETNTLACYVELKCCDCAAAENDGFDDDISDIDADGRHTWRKYHMRIDQIGTRVPAVPLENGSTYWGYTSVPEDGVVWWRRLPTRVI